MSRPSDYDQLMKLWDKYQYGIDDHNHHDEEFVSCKACQEGMDARATLVNKMEQVMHVLEEHHQVLGELTLSIIQEVPLPRPERVQKALREGLAVLTKGEL